MAGATIAYRLPQALRAQMREPFGKVYSENEFVVAVHGGRLKPPFIGVGDMVSETLIRQGLAPHVVLYDLHTQRADIDAAVQARLESYPARLVQVQNPAATLTRELVDAVRDAVRRAEPTRIRVDGEEDLATLPVLAYAPRGGTVIYGMPNRGLVAVPLTPAARQRAEEWLSLMKVD